jgi:hypothetical protein
MSELYHFSPTVSESKKKRNTRLTACGSCGTSSSTLYAVDCACLYICEQCSTYNIDDDCYECDTHADCSGHWLVSCDICGCCRRIYVDRENNYRCTTCMFECKICYEFAYPYTGPQPPVGIQQQIRSLCDRCEGCFNCCKCIYCVCGFEINASSFEEWKHNYLLQCIKCPNRVMSCMSCIFDSSVDGGTVYCHCCAYKCSCCNKRVVGVHPTSRYDRRVFYPVYETVDACRECVPKVLAMISETATNAYAPLSSLISSFLVI